MFSTVKSRSRMADSNLLLMQKYRCRTCGHLFEVLKTLGKDLKADVTCDRCGGVDLEPSSYRVHNDYYW